MAFFVYIVASGRKGTIYTGATDDLGKRIWEHKTKAGGFPRLHPRSPREPVKAQPMA